MLFKAGVSVGVRYSNDSAAAAEADDARTTSVQHCDLQPRLSQTCHEGSAGSSDYKPSVRPCRKPSKQHEGRKVDASKSLLFYNIRDMWLLWTRAHWPTFNTINKFFFFNSIKTWEDKWSPFAWFNTPPTDAWLAFKNSRIYTNIMGRYDCLNLRQRLKFSEVNMVVTSQIALQSICWEGLSLWSITTGLWHLLKCDRQPGDLEHLSAVSSQPRTTTGAFINRGDGGRSAEILDCSFAKKGFYCHGNKSLVYTSWGCWRVSFWDAPLLAQNKNETN